MTTLLLRKKRPQKRGRKSKHWCFTISNYTAADIPSIDNIQYLVMGKEIAPDTGTPHYQGYVVYNTQLRATQVKKLMPRAHIEIKYEYSTPQQAAVYCKKDGDWEEYGILPLTKEQGTMKRWDDARASARIGDFESIPSDLLIRYYHSFKRYYQDNPVKPQDLDERHNVWIYAPSGYGKSYYARKRYPDYYDKPPNKWFIGYSGEQTMLCDDYGPEQCRYLHWYMKRWADIFSFPMETKGGGKQIRPKHIIVTSQYTIEECFQDLETITAIKNRFKVKHLKHWKTGLRNIKVITYQQDTQLFTSTYRH